MNYLEAKGKMDYNFKDDSLYLYVDKFISKGDHKYSDSVDLKGFIVDLDEHKHVVGLELLDASQKLNVDKIVLKYIKQGKFDAKVEKDSIFVIFSFISIIRNKTKEFTLNAERINTPQIQESGLTCQVSS